MTKIHPDEDPMNVAGLVFNETRAMTPQEKLCKLTWAQNELRRVRDNITPDISAADGQTHTRHAKKPGRRDTPRRTHGEEDV